jgi:hypothetical protein
MDAYLAMNGSYEMTPERLTDLRNYQLPINTITVN